jgi:hypothetical protein
MVGARLRLFAVCTLFAFSAHVSDAVAASKPASTSAGVPDGSGGTLVVWEDQRGLAGSGVYAQRLDGAGASQWTSEGVAVCTAAGVQQYARVADGAGGAFVVWQDDRSGTFSNSDVYAQKLDASGVPQWTANGVLVCGAANGQTHPVAVLDGSGGLLVVWQDERGANADVYAQRLDASGVAQWAANGVVIGSGTGDQYAPVAVSDGAGGAILVWQDTRLGGSDLFAQRVNGSGVSQWTANGVALATATGAQWYPAIVSDGAGGAFVAWADSRTGIGDDIYAQRIDAAGSPQWTANGVVVCNAALHQAAPAILATAGGAIVVWEDDRGGLLEQDVYAQRLNGSGAVQWTAGGVPVCAAASFQGGMSAGPDGAGGVLVMWMDHRAGEDADAYAQRLDASGAALWTANGVALCTAVGSQFGGAIGTDGAGGAVAVWLDTRSRFETDVYAQRLDASGVAQWTANGASVRIDGMQRNVVSAPLGGGATMLVWMEKRAGQYDIRARKLDASGAPSWGSVAVCSAVDAQASPVVTSDGAGGAIVAWTDWRSGGTTADLFAQRVSGSGAVLWTPDGVPLSAAADAQEEPAIVSDGANGAIVVWQDRRDGITYDVYAQRVDATGAVVWATGGIAAGSAAGNQWHPALVADGVGGAIAVWQDTRDGLGYQTWAQRVDATGAAQWNPAGVLVCGASDEQGVPFATTDGAGGLVVAWTDARSFQQVAYAQRVSASGTVRWNANGVALVSGPGAHQVSAIAPAPAGGADVVWTHALGDDGDIVAQRVDSTGAVQWGAQGVSVAAAPGEQSGARACGDGAGGVYLAWEDSRAGGTDLYAARLDATGAPQWIEGGIALAAAAGAQRAPSLVTDEAGGVVVAWQDLRDGKQRFAYAARLAANGTQAWTSGGVVPTSLAFTRSDVSDGAVQLEWFGAGATFLSARVERSDEGSGEWTKVADIESDASGFFRFRDEHVVAGRSYGYRVAVFSDGAETRTAPFWIAVPERAVLALSAPEPNPARDALQVTFTLAGGRAAKLELLDVAGRRVQQWPLDGLGAGAHTRRFAPAGRVAPGIYALRLTEGGRTATRRVAIVR